MNEYNSSAGDKHQHPQTYSEVLTTHQSNLHPDLRRHIVGLAVEHDPEPPPSISDVAEYLRHRATDPDTDPMDPLLNGADKHMIKNALARSDYSAADLSGFLEEAIRSGITLQKRAAAQKHTPYTPPIADFMDTLETLKEAPASLMRTTYHTPGIDKPLRYLLERATYAIGHTDLALRLLEKAYNTDDIFDLVALKNSDPTLKHLLDNPKGMADYAITKRLKEPNPAWSEDKDPQEADLARHEWASKYLEQVAGLPDELRHDLEFASFSRNYNHATGRLNPFHLSGMLTRTALLARHHGIDDLILLRKKAGIVNFDYYPTQSNPDTGKTHSMLDSTVRLLKGDPEMIKHLQSGDVTVVFTDGRGDFDGSLVRGARNYATANQRTIYFEISAPQDFFRHMALLKMHNIKPSTMVMQAHGHAGMMSFGDQHSNDNFTLTNQYRLPAQSDKDKWPDNFGTLLEAPAIATIINEFMQDSRGIDDDEGAIGRRRVFLASCQQAAPKDVIRIGEYEGRLTYLRAQESMVETLALLANNPHVDYYASDDYIRVRRTKRGLRYERQVFLPDGTPKLDNENGPLFEAVAGLHIRIDNHGRLRQSRVEEMLMRRSGPGQEAA